MLSFIILVFCNGYGRIALDSNSYENPLFLIITSLAGWFFMYGLAVAFSKNNYLKNMFTVLGSKTKIIVFLHFLAFKLVNYTLVSIDNEPKYMTASFPVYNKNYWFIYTIVGIILPLGVDYVVRNVKKCIFKEKYE